MEVMDISAIVKIMGVKEIVQAKCTKLKKWGERTQHTIYLQTKKKKELVKETTNHQFSKPSLPSILPGQENGNPLRKHDGGSNGQMKGEAQRTPGMGFLALTLPLTIENLGYHTRALSSCALSRTQSDRESN